MKRLARLPPTGPPALDEITAHDALVYERTRWPSWQLRRAWWDRDRVPQELRYTAAPDPRAVLAGGRAFERYERRARSFEDRRRQWLESEAAP